MGKMRSNFGITVFAGGANNLRDLGIAQIFVDYHEEHIAGGRNRQRVVAKGPVVTRSCVGVKMAVEGLLPDRRDNCQLAFS